MPFQSKGLTNLDSVIHVRLTSGEKERLKMDADLACLSMSELVRARYFGRKVVAKSDVVMLNELRRIGGLLKHVHNQSGGAYSEQTSAALVDVRAYIKQLSGLMEKK